MTYSFQPDILPGFEQLRLDLGKDEGLKQPDGKLTATLVRKTRADSALPPRSGRPAVLYVHAFVDYFFHEHVAASLEAAGFDFYALDLRRSGRSINENNLPYFARKVDEFFPELDWALKVISEEQHSIRAMIAHSTGGLIASHYAQRGAEAQRFEKLLLNSPLLSLRSSTFENIGLNLMSIVGKFQPLRIAATNLDSTYGKTLHSDFDGEWQYNLDFKPLAGVPVHMGWLAMVAQASAQLKKGLSIKKPILTITSDSWHRSGTELRPKDHLADIILSSDDIRRLAPGLGPNSRTRSIPRAKHDVFLSREPAREAAMSATIDFLGPENS